MSNQTRDEIKEAERKVFIDNKTIETLGTSDRDVEEAIENVGEEITIEGKTLKEWNNYYLMSIPISDDLPSLRLKLIKLNDLLDRCSGTLTNLKLSQTKLSQITFVSKDIALEYSLKEGKSVTESTRIATSATRKLEASVKKLDGLVSFFEEISWRLKDKIKVFQILIFSKNGELRNLGI